MAIALTAAASPHIIAASMMVLLAAWLLLLDSKVAANRAFAAFLAFRAVEMLVGILIFNTTDAQTARTLVRTLPWASLAVIPTLIWFASVYPKRRGFFGMHPSGRKVLLASTVALYVLNLANPSLFIGLGQATVSNEFTWVHSTGLALASFGPLYLMLAARPLAMGIVAVVFAFDYIRKPPGSSRYSGLLVLAGLTLNALFDGATGIGGLIAFYGGGFSFEMMPFGWALLYLPPLSIVPAAAAVILLLAHGLGSHGSGATRTETVRFSVVSTLPLSTVFINAAFQGDTAVLVLDRLTAFLLGFWRVSLPVLATYALVRHKLFDIDLKVKWTLHKGIIAGAFMLAFFATSEFIEGRVETQLGPLVGVGAAGVLAFGFRPLERWAARTVQRIMPQTQPFDALAADERAILFQDQAALAYQDGTVTAKEREMLDRLSSRLGLTPEQAGSLERRVTQSG